MKSRIRKVVALGATLALGVSALAFANGASENVSTVNGNLHPNKLDKNKYKKSALNSGVTTYNGGDKNAHVNFPTSKTVLQYDDDGKVNLKVVPSCKTDLTTSTPAQAKKACNKSKMGTGKAHAVVGTTPVNDIKVTAYRKGSKLLLYTWSDTLDGGFGPGSTTDVTGSFSKAHGDYGDKVTFPVPPLIGGTAALTYFQVDLTKGITARCHDKNKTINTKAQFTYSDNSKDNASAKSKCKVKPSKHNKHHHKHHH